MTKTTEVLNTNRLVVLTLINQKIENTILLQMILSILRWKVEKSSVHEQCKTPLADTFLFLSI